MISSQDIYTLPQIDFVAGETQIIQVLLYVPPPWVMPFSATGSAVDLSIINLANKTGTPVLSKTGTIKVGDEGVQNVVEFELLSTDTKTLYGKYVYQIIVRNNSGTRKTNIPNQGIMLITKNINQNFIT